jgi:hypothetical protein
VYFAKKDGNDAEGDKLMIFSENFDRFRWMQQAKEGLGRLRAKLDIEISFLDAEGGNFRKIECLKIAYDNLIECARILQNAYIHENFMKEAHVETFSFLREELQSSV